MRLPSTVFETVASAGSATSAWVGGHFTASTSGSRVRAVRGRTLGNQRPTPSVRASDDPRLGQPSHRAPEEPFDRGGPSNDRDSQRWPTAARPDPRRAGAGGRPVGVQRPRDLLSGPALRPRGAHGAGSGPGLGRGPGGVLLSLSEPQRLSWWQRQELAQPNRDQRGNGPSACPQAATSP